MIKISNSALKYPPLKRTVQKIPDVLIYRPKSNFPNSYDVCMFKTDGSNSYVKMHYSKENQSINGKTEPYMHIKMLLSKPRKQGLGKKMLKYAVKLSKEIGCEGRIYLCADPQFTPNEIPHIFYRKFGMNTESEKVNSQLDEFIKEGKTATIKDFQKMKMYYPPIPTVPETATPEIKHKHKKFFLDMIKKLFNKKKTD